MDRISKLCVKRKKLQRVGKQFCILIPKPWLECLRWNQETRLTLEIHANGRKIVIEEASDIEQV